MEKIKNEAIAFDSTFLVSSIAIPRIQNNYLDSCRDFNLKDSLEKTSLYLDVSCWLSSDLFQDDIHTLGIQVIEDVFSTNPILRSFNHAMDEGYQAVEGPFLCIRKEREAENECSIELYKTSPTRDLPYTRISIYQYGVPEPKLNESKFKVGQKYWVFIKKID